jgi:hypothetical protein
MEKDRKMGSPYDSTPRIFGGDGPVSEYLSDDKSQYYSYNRAHSSHTKLFAYKVVCLYVLGPELPEPELPN